nr:hypothetical protein [Tanacetum cinerariifolium]
MCRRTHKARSHQCRAEEAKPKENPTEYCTKSGPLSLGWHTNDNEVSEQSGSTNPATASLTLDDNHQSRVVRVGIRLKEGTPFPRYKRATSKGAEMNQIITKIEAHFLSPTGPREFALTLTSSLGLGTPPTARKIEAWWEWNLEPDTRAELRKYRIPLVGFSSEVNYLPGIIDLRVTMGELDRNENEKLGSRGIHNSLDDKISNGQWNSNYDVLEKEGTQVQGKQLPNKKSSAKVEPSSPSKRDVAPEKGSKGKDEPAKAPKKQTSKKDTSLHRGTSIENLPTYRVNGPKKKSIALDRRKVVKKEVEECLNADDMVIKSKTEQDLIQDVKETLLTLKKVNMKLNPKNFSFKIEEGKFLGYIVTYEWIMANSEKSKAVMSMPSSSNLKQMQSLSGKLVALNKFLSKVVESVIPCLDTLKKYTNKKDFCWTEAIKKAFQAMKRLIAELPILTDPVKDDELLLYLSAAYEAVSAVLLVERKGSQLPIYYGHAIKVIADKPINQILNSPEASRRLGKWVVELRTYSISYTSRNAIKGQVLADFLADMVAGDGLTYEKSPSLDSSMMPKDVSESSKVREEQTESDPSVDMDNFSNSNNDTEYEALLAGLRIAKGMQEGKRVKQLEAVQCETLMNGFLLEDLNECSVDVAEVNMVVEEEGRTWMTPIREYIEKGTLLDDPAEARIVREKINNYIIEDGVLYQKSYLGLLIRCIGPLQENYVVSEIHMGSCRIHDGPRRVVHKAMNTWYYWPSMHQDANHEIKGYDACQEYAAVPRLPKDDKISVMSAWPFRK